MSFVRLPSVGEGGEAKAQGGGGSQGGGGDRRPVAVHVHAVGAGDRVGVGRLVHARRAVLAHTRPVRG